MLFECVFVFLLVYFLVTVALVNFRWIRKVCARKDPEEEKVEEPPMYSLPVQNIMEKSIEMLSAAIEAKDPYTNGHSKRVALYAREIARRMGKSEQYQQDIYFAGLLHDVGKIRIPDEVLRKRDLLSTRDYNIMKLHAMNGYYILQGISPDEKIEEAAKYHHERYDGNGYPLGLKGKEIPEFARIICVADTYDAMTSSRSFRNNFPQSFVKAELEMEFGRQFDPDIGKVMLGMIDDDKEYKLRQLPVNKAILIVDDDTISIKIVEQMLSKEPNFEIFTAKSGHECLDMMGEQKFDLVLLDVAMPEMDGFEVLSRIQAIDDVPVVFMTVDKDLSTIAKANEMGVSHYIIKPFMKPELMEVIRNVFHKREED